MNDLETAAKPWLTPMIHGITTTLPPDAQSTIAAWATKTALILEYARVPPRTPAPQWLAWLFDRGSCPPEAHVWLAAYARTNWMAHCVARGLAFGRPDRPADIPDGELVTVVVGHLVFQVLVWAHGQNFTIGVHPYLQPAVLAVWPPRGETLTWPPPLWLDEAGVGHLATAFA
jgi:hypothetical protein